MTPPDPSKQLTVQDRVTLGERARVRARRAKNEGGALFVISAVTALVAAVSFSGYHTSHQQYVEAIPKAFESLFLREHERRDGLNYPGIVAALFSATPETLPAEICDPVKSADCSDGKQLLDTFQSLFSISISQDAVRPPVSDNGPHAQCGGGLDDVLADALLAVLMKGVRRLDTMDACRWVRDAARDVTAIASPPAAETAPQGSGVEPCTTIFPKDEPHGVGTSGCISKPREDVFTLIPAETSELDPKNPAAPVGTYRERVRQALRLRDLLQLSLDRRALVRAHSGAGADRGAGLVRFVQTYFISPDSVLHIWASARQMTSFPRSRLWAAADYFQHFVESGDSSPYYTKPYEDFGGHGVVRTECRALTRPGSASGSKASPTGEHSNAAQFPATAAHELVGIVCVDFALSVLSDPQVLPQLAHHPLLHTAIVKIRIPSNEVDDVNDLGSEVSRPIPKDLLRQKVTEHLRTHPADLMRSPQLIHLSTKEGGFLIPIQEESDGVVSFLAAFPRDPRDLDRSLPQLVTALSFVLLWLFLVIANGFWAYRERQTRTRIALFRSLQTGVIETRGEEQVIIRANDRAEELARRKLPKELTNLDSSNHMSSGDRRELPGVNITTSAGAEGTYRFRDLARIAVRLKNEDPWALNAAQGPAVEGQHEYVPMTADEIAMYRAAGVTTRYWILLATTGKDDKEDLEDMTWLRVVAGPYVPMTRWKKRGDYMGPELMTYGIVERADESKRKDLSNWYRERYPKSQPLPLKPVETLPQPPTGGKI
jgi:hypothetical protein